MVSNSKCLGLVSILILFSRDNVRVPVGAVLIRTLSYPAGCCINLTQAGKCTRLHRDTFSCISVGRRGECIRESAAKKQKKQTKNKTHKKTDVIEKSAIVFVFFYAFCCSCFKLWSMSAIKVPSGNQPPNGLCARQHQATNLLPQTANLNWRRVFFFFLFLWRSFEVWWGRGWNSVWVIKERSGAVFSFCFIMSVQRGWRAREHMGGIQSEAVLLEIETCVCVCMFLM